MMNLAKWKPWNWFKEEEAAAGDQSAVRPSGDRNLLPILQLQRETDRLFDGLLKGISPAFGSLLNGIPRMDISETSDSYLFEVDLPGMTAENVTLTIQERTLRIHGERKKEAASGNRQDHRVERVYGMFERLLSLPDDADEDAVQAQFSNGVLRVTVKKLENAAPPTQSKQITIQTV